MARTQRPSCLLWLTLIFLFAPTYSQNILKVGLGYSPQVDSIFVDVKAEIALQISGANLVFENSEIDIRMQLARLFRCDVPIDADPPHYVCEWEDFFELDTVRGPPPTPLDNPYYGRNFRQKYSVDMFVFYTHGPNFSPILGGTCGGVGTWIEAGACAGYDPGMILAHEVSHQVADHDRHYGHGTPFPPNGGGLGRYPFAYGYYNKPTTLDSAKRWRDDMSYECLSFGDRERDSLLGTPWWPCPAPHPVVPYMSNPNVYYPPTGEPMGTDSENVARALNIYKDTLTSRGTESGYLLLQDTLFAKEIGNPEAIDSMTVTNFLVKDTGELNIRAGHSVTFQNFELRDLGSMSVFIGEDAGPLPKTARQRPIRDGKKPVEGLSARPPQIVRAGNEFYLLNAEPAESLRLEAFDIQGRRLFARSLNHLGGNTRYHLPISGGLPGGLLMFRMENERGVFWSKAGPR